MGLLTVTLPPTPKPATTLAAYAQNVSIWTKQCQQILTQVGKAFDSVSSSISGLPIASASQTGLLSSTDWSTFNSKQPAGAYLLDAPSDGTIYGRKNGAWVSAGGALTFGNLTELTSSVLTIAGGMGAVIGSGTSITVKQASGSQAGYISSTDWTTFNGKQAALTLGNLTELTSSVLTIAGGTGAIIGSGLTITVSQSSGSQAGYLSSTDWTTFNGKLSDAPNNSNTYARQGGAWVTIGSGGVSEAPTDGGIYSRQNSAWYQLYPPAPATSLFAWWKMNEGSGTTTSDASGSGLTGTLSGTTIPTWTTGPSGGSDKALQFNGASSYVTTANTSYSAGVISISCWLKRANWQSTAHYCPIFGMNYNSTTGIGFILTAGAFQDWVGNALLIVSNGFNTAQTPRGSSVALPLLVANSWHHVGVVLGPNNCDFYFDGLAIPAHVLSPGTIPTLSTQPIVFGGNPATSDWSDAAHDDLRVLARAVSAREMYALFLAGAI